MMKLLLKNIFLSKLSMCNVCLLLNNYMKMLKNIAKWKAGRRYSGYVVSGDRRGRNSIRPLLKIKNNQSQFSFTVAR